MMKFRMMVELVFHNSKSIVKTTIDSDDIMESYNPVFINDVEYQLHVIDGNDVELTGNGRFIEAFALPILVMAVGEGSREATLKEQWQAMDTSEQFWSHTNW